MPRLVPPTAFLLAAALALPALGADVAIDRIDVGFGGIYKAGDWTPLAVTMHKGGAGFEPLIVETVTADADGASVVRASETRTVETSDSSAVTYAVFQSGRLGSDLSVRLRSSSGELLAERRARSGSPGLRKALPKGATLWVTTGAFNTTGEGGAKSSLPVPDGVTAAPLTYGPLSDPLGYAAADLLLVRGDFAPTPDQAAAIRDWVAGGGHLAVALGRHADAFRSGTLADAFRTRGDDSTIAGIAISGTVQLFDLTRIEAYSRSDRRLPRARRVTAARVTGAPHTLLGGAGEDSEGGLIVRGPYGFGRVTLFAFDLDEPPFSNWAALPDVLARALVEKPRPDDRGERRDDAGVTDLASQLMRAEETLPGVNRPTTGRALLLLLLYAAIVGPVDYLLVHRVLRRPALTWLTLPLIVLGAAWWLDHDAVAANGRSSQVSRLDLIDLDAADDTVRARTAVTLYSSTSTRADVTLSSHTDAWNLPGIPAVPHLAWIAPPEEAFGGTFRETSGGLFRSEYVIPPPTEVARTERLPLLTGGSRRFTASGQRRGAEAVVESDLTARGRGLLEGRVTHHLPGPLHGFIIAFGDRVYRPAHESAWYPDEPMDLGSGAFLRQDLGSFLRRAQTKQIKRKPGEGGQDYIVTEGTYDALSTDPGDIVRILTFHRAAGGTAYTGLTNFPLASDDLSPLLDLGRVVVLGRLDTPAADATVSPAFGPPFQTTRQITFVRLVLPVRRLESDPPSVLPTDPRAAGRTP